MKEGGGEEENQKSKGKEQKAKIEFQSPTPNTQHPAPTLVGREAELEQLHVWLEKALSGQRQVVFVTGEPGIGKTALVEVFLEQLAADKRLTVARGQCVEQYGVGEAYLPILEALGRLCRGGAGDQLKALLAARSAGYARAEHVLDTSGRSIDACLADLQRISAALLD